MQTADKLSSAEDIQAVMDEAYEIMMGTKVRCAQCDAATLKLHIDKGLCPACFKKARPRP